MNTYVATKIVRAEPMGQIDFLRDKWEKDPPGVPFSTDIPEDLPGYRVFYPDGYVSWSPKGVFEITSRPITNDELDLVMEDIDDVGTEEEGGTDDEKA